MFMSAAASIAVLDVCLCWTVGDIYVACLHLHRHVANCQHNPKRGRDIFCEEEVGSFCRSPQLPARSQCLLLCPLRYASNLSVANTHTHVVSSVLRHQVWLRVRSQLKRQAARDRLRALEPKVAARVRKEAAAQLAELGIR